MESNVIYAINPWSKANIEITSDDLTPERIEWLTHMGNQEDFDAVDSLDHGTSEWDWWRAYAEYIGAERFGEIWFG